MEGFDAGLMDRAIAATLEAIHGGKEQVFAIAQFARNEKDSLQAESMQTRTEVEQTIAEVDRLEVAYRRAKQRLSEVSRNFGKSSEFTIKEAYDEAHGLQVKLLLAKERENRLRAKRDELVRRIRRIDQTIERADSLVTQLGVAFSYLSGDLQKLGAALKTAENRQYLGVRIIQAQEEERRRVAREIHDGPAQMMANMVLRTEICERMLDRDISKVREELGELKNTVRESLTEVRQIIFDLRPMALDDLGLIPALRKYVTVFQERQGIQVDFRVLGQERRLPPSVEVALFRTAQECLTNAYKHANATLLTVVIELTPNQVNLQVKDNGVGFSVGSQSHGDGEHFGLFGMRERLALLGGKLEVRSKPGAGTRIAAMLPLDEEGGNLQ